MLGLDLSITQTLITLALTGLTLYGITRKKSLDLISLTWYIITRKNKTVSYEKIDICGKFAIVTGANTGIGKETARQLAQLGARVILACRDVTKGNGAADDIRTTVTDADLLVKHLDLADFTSVKKFCDDVFNSRHCVDILINNAAVSGIPETILPDGMELTFVTNHLGHHLLTRLLLPMIQLSDIKRIVIVSAIVYRFGEIEFSDDDQLVPNGGIQQYANTKLMNCLLATELHRRFSSKDVSAFALHPGIINTNLAYTMTSMGVGLLRYVLKPLIAFVCKHFYSTVERGSETTMYCATAKGLEAFSGKFFDNCQLCPWHLNGMDGNMARRLWDYCEAKVHNYL